MENLGKVSIGCGNLVGNVKLPIRGIFTKLSFWEYFEFLRLFGDFSASSSSNQKFFRIRFPSQSVGLPCSSRNISEANADLAEPGGADPEETGESHLLPGHRRLSRISEYTWLTAPRTRKVGAFDPTSCSTSSTEWLPVLVPGFFLVDASPSAGSEDRSFSTWKERRRDQLENWNVLNGRKLQHFVRIFEPIQERWN